MLSFSRTCLGLRLAQDLGGSRDDEVNAKTNQVHGFAICR
jgi:hypothetical protein